MVSSKKKSALRILRNIVISALVFLILTFAVTKVIYDATFGRYDPQGKVVYTASDSLLAVKRDVSFLSGKNTLSGCVYGTGGDILVVLVPGYRATIDDYIPQIESLVAGGFGVFAFDTTGSGKSGGDSAIGFSQALIDTQAALTFSAENDSFGYKNTVLFGHSRGGYAACCALKGDFKISAVVSVAGVNSAMEGIMEPVADKIGFLAYSNYPMLWAYQAMLFGTDVVDADAAEIISGSDVPVLIIHGKGDTQVSYDEYSVISHRDEIKSDNVEFLVCDTKGSDGHINLLFDGDGANRQLMQSIYDFYLRSVS